MITNIPLTMSELKLLYFGLWALSGHDYDQSLASVILRGKIFKYMTDPPTDTPAGELSQTDRVILRRKIFNYMIDPPTDTPAGDLSQIDRAMLLGLKVKW